MKIHHVLLLLATALGRMRGETFRNTSCHYECHSDGSCSLQVTTYKDWNHYARIPVTVHVPRCKPCAVVCQVRPDGVVGGYEWIMFQKDDRIDLDEDQSNKSGAAGGMGAPIPWMTIALTRKIMQQRVVQY